MLRRANSRRGLKALSGPELSDLGKLYKRVTSDLAYAKANSSNEQLISYLNELAGRAHGLLYTDKPISTSHSLITFLLSGFPILFRAKWKFIAFATGMMIASTIFAAIVVKHNPAVASHWIPFTGGSDQPVNTTPAQLSGYLMTHNILVSIMAFAGGITFGAFTAYAIIGNGLMLGAFLVKPYKFLHGPLDVIAFIFPHGVIELTAICISGAAGLILASALIAPGNLSRLDSLKKASKEALPLMGGVAIMLVIAGCIEGCVARSQLDRSLKIAIAGLTAVGLLAYFGLAGRSHSGRQVK